MSNTDLPQQSASNVDESQITPLANRTDASDASASDASVSDAATQVSAEAAAPHPGDTPASPAPAPSGEADGAASPTNRKRAPISWLTPIRAALIAAGIAVLAFAGGFGTGFAVTAATTPSFPENGMMGPGMSGGSDQQGPGGEGEMQPPGERPDSSDGSDDSGTTESEQGGTGSGSSAEQSSSPRADDGSTTAAGDTAA